MFSMAEMAVAFRHVMELLPASPSSKAVARSTLHNKAGCSRRVDAVNNGRMSYTIEHR